MGGIYTTIDYLCAITEQFLYLKWQSLNGDYMICPGLNNSKGKHCKSRSDMRFKVIYKQFVS